MPRNGTGLFTRPVNGLNSAAPLVVITANDWNQTFTDYDQAVSFSLASDGQTTATARIPFAQGLGVSPGTAASPSISNLSDLTTGIYFPAAAQIGVSVSGVQRLLGTTTALRPVVDNTFSLGSTTFSYADTYSSMFFARVLSGAATPSYTFNGDTDTGFYNSAANEISASTGGVQRVRWTTAGFEPATPGGYILGSVTNPFSADYSNTFLAGFGSAGAPSLTFNGDTNTGFYRAGADTIGVSTGGTQQLSILTNSIQPVVANTFDLGAGGLGFGNGFFNVLRMQAGSAANPAISFAGDNTQGFYRENNNGISLSLNGISRVRWISSPTLSYIPTTDNAVALGGASNRWTAVYAVNGTIQTSDERVKQDMSRMTDGLDIIRKLEPIRFKFIEDEEQRQHYGFTAQKLEAMPETKDLVYSKEGTAGMSYAELIAPLVSAVQKLDARLRTIETRIG